MNEIAAGVARFQSKVYPGQRELFDRLADRQDPQVLFLTCADSRVDPMLITQSQPGQLFICRNIGNVVPPHGTSDGSVATVMEYAIRVLRIPHIIICGHSNCGAMTSLLNTPYDPALPRVTAWLNYAETPRRLALKMQDDDSGKDFLRTVTEQNVIAQMLHLRTYPEVAVGLAEGSLQLHGWYYDIGTGEVDAYDETRQVFSPLAAVVSA
jgi:carbonic anhydrase